MTAKTDAAPERIWIDTVRGMDGFFAVSGADLPRTEADRETGVYLLATPEALARQPEVQELIAAAVKAEREEIARLRAMMSDEGYEFPELAGVAGKAVDVLTAVTTQRLTFDPDFAKKEKP